MPNNKSPSKKLRSLTRLNAFLRRKINLVPQPPQPKLSLLNQEQISILPSQPNLSQTKVTCFSVPPKLENVLCMSKTSTTSIAPKLIYHPNIHNVCLSMFEKTPYSLSPEEITKFKVYRNWKVENGEPIEDDIMWLPSGGTRKCLHCDELTWRDLCIQVSSSIIF